MMKLSDRSIQVLKNFSSINPSIQFKEGNVLKTISPKKTVLASASLDTQIPNDFAIYDLSRFLGVLSMIKDANFEVQEKLVNISTAGRKVSYTFADPSTIITPPDRDIDIGESDVNFRLEEKQLDEIQRAMGVMSFPDLVVTSEDGKIILRATNSKVSTSDKYDIEVGETDQQFNVVFKAENIKLMSDSYDVAISSKGIGYFKSDSLQYWISIESTSTFS
jgi:hypothetical protein